MTPAHFDTLLRRMNRCEEERAELRLLIPQVIQNNPFDVSPLKQIQSQRNARLRRMIGLAKTTVRLARHNSH